MISGNANAVPAFTIAITSRKTSMILGPAINKITDKNCLATIGRSDRKSRLRLDRVAKLLKQRIQFIETAVDVANNVERPVFLLQVVP